jgi:hypothetical protein
VDRARPAGQRLSAGQLKLFDRYGNRRDEVDFHPSWHECLGWLKRHGCDTGPWADPKPGAHVARAAAYVMFAEIECGSLCPTTMTYGAVPVLRHVPESPASGCRNCFRATTTRASSPRRRNRAC